MITLSHIPLPVLVEITDKYFSSRYSIFKEPVGERVTSEYLDKISYAKFLNIYYQICSASKYIDRYLQLLRNIELELYVHNGEYDAYILYERDRDYSEIVIYLNNPTEILLTQLYDLFLYSQDDDIASILLSENYRSVNLFRLEYKPPYVKDNIVKNNLNRLYSRSVFCDILTRSFTKYHQLDQVDLFIPYNLKLLGSGSYGAVYKLGNSAVKCFIDTDAKILSKSKVGKLSVDNFIYEMNILKMIDNRCEYIITVRDYDYRSLNYNILFEYMPITLSQYFEKNLDFSDVTLLSITYQILLALEFLEINEIIHTDVKEQNIMLDLSTSIPRAKLIDFGLALPLTYRDTSGITQTFSVIAPEVNYLSTDLSIKIDVWSLGIMFYNNIFKTEKLFRDTMILYETNPVYMQILILIYQIVVGRDCYSALSENNKLLEYLEENRHSIDSREIVLISEILYNIPIPVGNRALLIFDYVNIGNIIETVEDIIIFLSALFDNKSELDIIKLNHNLRDKYELMDFIFNRLLVFDSDLRDLPSDLVLDYRFDIIRDNYTRSRIKVDRYINITDEVASRISELLNLGGLLYTSILNLSQICKYYDTLLSYETLRISIYLYYFYTVEVENRVVDQIDSNDVFILSTIIASSYVREYSTSLEQMLYKYISLESTNTLGSNILDSVEGTLIFKDERSVEDVLNNDATLLSLI